MKKRCFSNLKSVSANRNKFALLWFTMWFFDCISLKVCLVSYLFLRAFSRENALSFFLWPLSLRLWKRVEASTWLCSASSLMSFSSFSNVSSGVMFGFPVYRKDFGQVRFVRFSSNSHIECSVFASLFSMVSGPCIFVI